MSSLADAPRTDGRWADARCVASDGVRIAFRDYGGDGPDLLLLPGIGGNLEAEHETALQLAESWRVVSIDPRGIGQSGDPETIDSGDFMLDVDAVVEAQRLQPAAVVGHSMGGVIAGVYGASHPEVPVVSIDGFGAGVASVGTAEDHQALRRYMEVARAGLRAMSGEPSEGDARWKAGQTEAIRRTLDGMNYRAGHRDAMVARQFVSLPDGRWRRHPSRNLVTEAERAAFGAEPANILQMFRDCVGPVLIVRCTKSNWPAVLDAELGQLIATRPNISVQRLPLTHTGPVTGGVAMTVATVSAFLTDNTPAEPSLPRQPSRYQQMQAETARA